MRACAIAAIAVWAASSAVASAADVSAGGPVTGYGPYAYSPRIEPLIVYDYQPGVIVRSYWWSPWQNRHYFPKTGKRPKVGRLERVTARKSSPAAGLLPLLVGLLSVRTGTPAAAQSTVHATLLRSIPRPRSRNRSSSLYYCYVLCSWRLAT